MIIALLCLGLVVIPLYDIIFRLFPNVEIIASDTRGYKEIMLIAFTLALGLAALYHQGIKKFNNKWILIFMMFQVVTLSMAFNFPLAVNDVPTGAFWYWKPLFIGLCSLLALTSIASLKLSINDLKKIMFIMCVVAAIEAIYVIIQSLGFDQIFNIKDVKIIGFVKFPGRVGTLGQPTLVSSFIVMIIPISIYLKRYFLSAIMTIAVILTDSQMAIGAMVLGIIVYAVLINKKLLYIAIPLILAVTIFLAMNKQLIGDSGRFPVWKSAIAEIKHGTSDGKIKNHCFTGYGQGSYPYIFNKGSFKQVHNEYIELAYNCGLIGLFLFLMSLFYTAKNSFRSKLSVSLISSLITISLCAFGTFVWQLGAHIFYTITIVGLLNNDLITGGENV